MAGPCDSGTPMPSTAGIVVPFVAQGGVGQEIALSTLLLRGIYEVVSGLVALLALCYSPHNLEQYALITS